MARCHAQFEKIEKFDKRESIYEYFEKIEKFDKIESIYGDIREDIY